MGVKAGIVALALCVSLPLASRAQPAIEPGAAGCHPSGIAATRRANLDRDARLERVLTINASCAHEATVDVVDNCRGRNRVYHIRGFGWLEGFQVTEANARADGRELAVGFRPQKPLSHGFGRVVLVHLEPPRAGACSRPFYLFELDLDAPPAGKELTDLLVELTQLEPASASKELRVVEVFGERGQRESHARYDAQTGRYLVYETTRTARGR